MRVFTFVNTRVVQVVLLDHAVSVRASCKSSFLEQRHRAQDCSLHYLHILEQFHSTSRPHTLLMQTQTQSKKRPAPGSVPITPNITQTLAQSYGPSFLETNDNDASAMSDDQFMAWGTGNPTGNQRLESPAQVLGPTDPFTLDHQSTQLFSNSAQAPGQLIRRATNNQLTRQMNHYAPLDQDIWNDISNEVPEAVEFVEDDEELEKRAALAKKDAQSKRPPKQIPPFIQKLSRSGNSKQVTWADG